MMCFLKILNQFHRCRSSFHHFFATAIFCELAIGSIFKIEPSQARISLFVGFFMLVGIGFFFFQE